MVDMKFGIEFHGPFRVGTGHARPGADVTVSREHPLPGASLKGAMRAAARVILPGRQDLVDAVFGTARQASPWSWASARLSGETIRRRARVAISETTRTAEEHALMVGEEILATEATFEVTQLAEVSNRRDQETVLLASGHAVHSIGADRRRGLGWVTIRGIEPRLDEARMDEFFKLRGHHA